MTEVERLKKADVASKAFRDVRERIDQLATEDVFPAISAIDNGDFDDTLVEDMQWKGKRRGAGESG
jgi:hypothetical protein